MHTQFDLAAVLCLLGICLGALVYGLADLSFSISGYVWLTMNVIAISWYQVMMKNIASQKLLNTLGMTLYNNVLSVPLFMLQTIINKEGDIFSKLKSLTNYFSRLERRFIVIIRSRNFSGISCVWNNSQHHCSSDEPVYDSNFANGSKSC
mmetsp:Transcript_26221/g.86234  ORF Transcript_26221/g.86234 Transcript_26221/m.86234 type:complete len:150 (-) Transcript_26221:304-753(-)